MEEDSKNLIPNASEFQKDVHETSVTRLLSLLEDMSDDDMKRSVDNIIVRHLLVTIAYRTMVAVKDCPASYPDFHAGIDSRTPAMIINHITHLLTYVISMIKNEHGKQQRIQRLEPLPWQEELKRLLLTLKKLDSFVLANCSMLLQDWQTIVQGPLADALTHVGQLALLRRLSGSPIEYQNYIVVPLKPGDFSLFDAVIA